MSDKYKFDDNGSKEQVFFGTAHCWRKRPLVPVLKRGTMTRLEMKED